MNDGSQVSGAETTQQVQSTTPASGNQTQEKLLRQSEVNDIVGRVKHESYEKGKTEAQAEWQRNQSQTSQNTSQNNQQTIGGMSQMTPDEIRKLVKEASKEASLQTYQEAEQQVAAQKIVGEFVGKINRGKDRYSDFEQVVSPLQLQTIPQIVALSNKFDNTEDIIYDLGKYPAKVAPLVTLAAIAPHLAEIEMRKLSEDIKSNQNSANKEQNVREPHSQMKPSNIGNDNGAHSISDLRKQPWLKA
jgi:hypothetical protein